MSYHHTASPRRKYDYKPPPTSLYSSDFPSLPSPSYPSASSPPELRRTHAYRRYLCNTWTYLQGGSCIFVSHFTARGPPDSGYRISAICRLEEACSPSTHAESRRRLAIPATFLPSPLFSSAYLTPSSSTAQRCLPTQYRAQSFKAPAAISCFILALADRLTHVSVFARIFSLSSAGRSWLPSCPAGSSLTRCINSKVASRTVSSSSVLL